MRRRDEGSYRERNGIGTCIRPRRTPPTPSASSEQELADTRAALNLARERAEADLEEAASSRINSESHRRSVSASAPRRPPVQYDRKPRIAAELLAVIADRRARASLAKPRTAPATVPAS